MGDEKRIIEAALFISARPMALEEFRTLTGIGALGFLRDAIESLKKDYAERAIEILEADGKYEMRVKSQYLERVKQYAQETEISKSALRTLAYISRHDGILKSELVKRVGTQAYYDVRELVDNGFLKTRKAGRTSKLTLTEKFKKYFSLKEIPRQQTMGEATAPEPLPEMAAPAEEGASSGEGGGEAEEESEQMTL